MLEAVRFAGGTEAQPLIEALGILRELNATGARNVPGNAPIAFVPARWQGYLDEAAAKGDATAYRHYWELCTLIALRDGLRSGDVYVPGSRRYDNPAVYLFTPVEWDTHRAEFCRLVGKSPDFSEALSLVMHELDDALTDLEDTLMKGDGPVRLNDDGELVICCDLRIFGLTLGSGSGPCPVAAASAVPWPAVGGEAPCRKRPRTSETSASPATSRSLPSCGRSSNSRAGARSRSVTALWRSSRSGPAAASRTRNGRSGSP